MYLLYHIKLFVFFNFISPTMHPLTFFWNFYSILYFNFSVSIFISSQYHAGCHWSAFTLSWSSIRNARKRDASSFSSANRAPLTRVLRSTQPGRLITSCTWKLGLQLSQCFAWILPSVGLINHLQHQTYFSSSSMPMCSTNHTVLLVSSFYSDLIQSDLGDFLWGLSTEFQFEASENEMAEVGCMFM